MPLFGKRKVGDRVPCFHCSESGWTRLYIRGQMRPVVCPYCDGTGKEALQSVEADVQTVLSA
jgi:hypothetical protein